MTAPADSAVPSRFFVLGEVVADPDRNVLLRHGEVVKLEPKVMALLTYLAANPGRIVSKDELIARVWNGTHVVDEAVQRAVSLLRAALDDDARRPRVIETVPSRGYRLMVTPQSPEPPAPQAAAGLAASRPMVVAFAALATVLIIAVLLLILRRQDNIAPEAPAPSPTPQAQSETPAPAKAPPAPVGAP